MLNRLFFFILLISGLFFSSLGFAANKDIYIFDSPQQQFRFQQLSQQFRCIVCQNETLAQSNTPLAKDLRYQIYKMIKKNQSNEAVVNALTAHYGDFLSFHGPVTRTTYLLWSLPLILLLAGLGRFGWLIICRYRHKQSITYRFSKEDRKRIRHLLREY